MKDIKDLRRKVINLATSIALQETAQSGQDYCKATNKALDEACERIGVDRKQFIKMFIQS